MEINNRILESIGLSLVHSLWQGALLLFIVLAALVIARNKSASFRYLITLTGTFLLPTILVVNLIYFWPATTVDNPMQAMESFPTSMPDIPAQSSSISFSPQSSPTIMWLKENAPAIAICWFLGMVIFLLKTLGSFLWLRRLTNKALPFDNPATKSLIETIKGNLSLKRPIELKLSTWIKSPVILGIIRPTILFPIGLIEGLTTEEVEAILYHELAHLKRNDFVINIIINVLQIVFFYHPAYWWLKSQLDNDREFATDELALKYSAKKLPMIKALAKVQAYSLTQPGLGFAGNSKNQVLKRINLIMKAKQQPNWLSAVFTMVILMAAFGLMSVQEKKTESGKVEKHEDINVDLKAKVDSIRSIKTYFSIPQYPYQKDSIELSKAILELVTNQKAFEFSFSEKGEITTIQKDGKALSGSEFNHFKSAYMKLKGFNEASEKPISNNSFTRDRVRYNINSAYEVDSIWLDGKLLEGAEREFHLENWRKWEREKLEREFMRLHTAIEKELKSNSDPSLVRTSKIEEYKAMLVPLEGKLQRLNSSINKQKEYDLKLLEKQIQTINKAKADNDQIERELQRRELIQSVNSLEKKDLKDSVPPRPIYELNGELISNMSLAKINMQRIESIRLIQEEEMYSKYPKEQLEGVSGIISITTKPEFTENEKKTISKIKGTPAIELDGQLLKGVSLSEINLQNVLDIQVVSGRDMYKYYSKNELNGSDGLIRITTQGQKKKSNNLFEAVSKSRENSKYFFNSDTLRVENFDHFILEKYKNSKKVLVEFEGKILEGWTVETLKREMLNDIRTIEVLKGDEMEKHYSKRTLRGIDVLLRVNSKN